MRPELFWEWVNTTAELQYEAVLKLDCICNQLTLLPVGRTLQLNEAQKRLFACLIQGRTSKLQLQHYIWHDNPQQDLNNSYHQLLHQIRQLLKKNRLPAMLFTVPGHGVRLNIAELKTPYAAAGSLVNLNAYSAVSL